MDKQFQPTIGIYALCDPTTGRVMYIGKSTDTEYRYRQHSRHEGRYSNVRKSEWIAALARDGLKPKLVILEQCVSHIGLDEAEQKWIYLYKTRGEAELNISIGGAGIFLLIGLFFAGPASCAMMLDREKILHHGGR